MCQDAYMGRLLGRLMGKISVLKSNSIINYLLVVFVESYINNGAVDENNENLGISHLLEHICTDGWSKCKNNCSDYWKKRGVILNASTGQTYVNYFIKGLPEYLKEMVDYIVVFLLAPPKTLAFFFRETKIVCLC